MRLSRPQGESARLLEPDEVAEMVRYLAEAEAVTGAALSIDIGLTAGVF